MKAFYTLLFLALSFSVSSQNFNGQWKGGFVDNSLKILGLANEKIDYVLELECNGTDVTGYSYTYFNEGGKRYYTICKLKGDLNRSNKEITVTEFERTKFNTPPDFRNCFQTHKLKYVKNSDGETLEGNWYPAPDQQGGCGYGHTVLNRRTVQKITFNNPKTSPPSEIKKDQPFKDMNRQPKTPVVIKPNPDTKKPSKPLIKNQGSIDQNKKPVTTENPVTIKKDTGIKKENIAINPPVKNEIQTIEPKEKFEKRANTILKTIDIEQEKFTVDLYDDGEIDGDSVSVFYNGKLLLSHKRLTDKPITLTLTVDPTKEINELVMYAENLGEIPPNTALMIITNGTKRYEVRITSDTERNGAVMFRRKSK